MSPFLKIALARESAEPDVLCSEKKVRNLAALSL
jgi:hypothetical protein